MKPASPSLRFRVRAGNYAVCRVAPDDPVPAWARGRFLSVTRTRDELSIICAARAVPAAVQAARGWRLIELVGPFPLTATGVMAAVARPLASARISVLAIATYDTDYFLVPRERLEEALMVLAQAGHVRVR